MAIYCRWGEVKIVAYYGEHQPDYLSFPWHLLSVKWSDSLGTEKTFFQWAEVLKADNSWHEIKDAMYKAREVELSPEELQNAFKRAE
jgi:hypothetical protein